MFSVIKRDGEKTDFILSRIGDAMRKAFEAEEMQYNNDIIDMLEKSDIDPRRRAETLSVEEWMRLFEEYKSRI